MKVAIMQPYIFPYIGYWQLIANCDEFIFFDVVQYNKKSWMNRNRIIHPDKPDEFQFISVPIKKHSHGTLIKDIKINNDESWKSKILGQLTAYKKLKAPHYDETISLVNQIFDKEYRSFLDLCIESTRQVCKHLQIGLQYKVASEIDFDRSFIKAPGDWALAISKMLKVSHYINPYSGYEIFDEKKYNENKIDIQFIKPKLTCYEQSWRKEFIGGLSILDVLMFNDKQSVKDMLINDFDFLSKTKLIDQLKGNYQ
jgi:hypothetical protein